jgi:hypothetical protein
MWNKLGFAEGAEHAAVEAAALEFGEPRLAWLIQEE